MISGMEGLEKLRLNFRRNINKIELRLEKRDVWMPEETEKKTDIKREVISWVIYLAVIVALTFFIVTYVGQRTRVSGQSMENTLHDGDNLIVHKITYRYRDPKR